MPLSGTAAARSSNTINNLQVIQAIYCPSHVRHGVTDAKEIAAMF
jgi:hypothetical protein